ncbi:MAG: type II toxin-antitoxin system PemK/MazF family toxin [Chloroflexi bacterium]|nr:type II toxin-antitoxin system PemK/MazF family toxin [Chloroflexota bacterium]
MGVVAASRFDVVLVRLDPTRGSEIRKTRPCVVISPDEMNRALRTVVIAPMTTQGHAYPWRISVTFAGKAGRVALDQIRTVHGERLLTRVGQLDADTASKVLGTLAEMFGR